MPTRSSPRSSSGSGFLPFLLGFVLACACVVGGLWAYLHVGPVPVAIADKPLPYERQITHQALDARIKREMKQPPFGISEDVYEAGATLYVTHCAFCHGTPGHDSIMTKAEYPHAPQLWKKHANSAVVGVSDDEPGETEWKIANGIRLSGMPAYDHVLNDTQSCRSRCCSKTPTSRCLIPFARFSPGPP